MVVIILNPLLLSPLVEQLLVILSGESDWQLGDANNLSWLLLVVSTELDGIELREGLGRYWPGEEEENVDEARVNE